MSRVIKFRAWGKDGWIDSQFFIDAKDGKAFDSLVITPHSSYSPIMRAGEVTLMQFTGLFDKNGKEIYEGDVIEFMHSGKKVRALVEWIDNDAGFNSVQHNPLDNEIIGNIYENPELIKQP